MSPSSSSSQRILRPWNLVSFSSSCICFNGPICSKGVGLKGVACCCLLSVVKLRDVLSSFAMGLDRPSVHCIVFVHTTTTHAQNAQTAAAAHDLNIVDLGVRMRCPEMPGMRLFAAAALKLYIHGLCKIGWETTIGRATSQLRPANKSLCHYINRLKDTCLLSFLIAYPFASNWALTNQLSPYNCQLVNRRSFCEMATYLYLPTATSVLGCNCSAHLVPVINTKVPAIGYCHIQQQQQRSHVKGKVCRRNVATKAFFSLARSLRFPSRLRFLPIQMHVRARAIQTDWRRRFP